MKFAVCLSGQARFGSFAFRALAENLLRGLDCEVFLFLWRLDRQSEDEALALAESYIGRHAVIRACSVQKQIEFQARDYETRIHPGSNVFNIQSMYYSVKMANELKVEHEKKVGSRFDCVIRTRVDVSCFAPMDLSVYRSLLGDYVFVPDVSYYQNGLNDTFAFSSSENMDIAAGLYDRLDDYFRTENIMFNPHIMLNHHLIKNHIPVAFLSIPAEIVRELPVPRMLEG